jgi:TRAP transporter TAXI family solute receptor
LRAVASLFPEAVQLVVRKEGSIRSVADLAGKRVDIGLDHSGSRANALAVLAAEGVAVEALASVTGSRLPDAVALLAAGKIDAIFVTMHAPARELQVAASRTRLAWIDLLPTDALKASGLMPLKLPARSYPGQNEPVQTLATVSLMVTRADVPVPQVEAMLTLLFDGRNGSRTETAAVSRIDRQTAREGVPIPWFPAADAWLDKKPPLAPAVR